MAIESGVTMAAEPAGPRARAATDSACFVLLDDNLTPGGRCALFEHPVEIVRCDEPAGVESALGAIAGAPARGLHAAGFLAYELGYLLEPKLAPLLPAGRAQPLIWMGLFERRQELDAGATRRLIAARTQGDHRIDRLRPSLSRDDYLALVGRVKDYIAAGDVYQINLTFKMLFDFAGDPLSLYARLRRQQRVAHGALIRAPDFDLLSLSPELFLSVVDGRALARPMKGTAARGKTPEEDAEIRAWLRNDEKSRAENLMIVDLVRNDLSRVAEIGTVQAPEIFTVETYPSVHQMTSSVTARLRPGIGARELIRSLFPCGSITGAPKVRAMEIIRELEAAPRGVYTGAIGAFAPDGGVAFNVAIRTVLLDRAGRGELGIGAGIVHDSVPEAEFEECLLKARFLTEPQRPFQLIETLRWTKSEGFYLLAAHLDRLAASAAYFGFPYDTAEARRGLEATVAAAVTAGAAAAGAPVLRTRLLLDEDGGFEITIAPVTLPAPDALWRYAVSERPVDPDDRFLYHKTTRRELFESELARLRAATGCDDVIFLNTRGEVTEASRSNVFIERDGRLVTPPETCGLLAGTLRRALFDDPAVAIEARVLGPNDLATADKVFLGNSVRGLVRALPVEVGRQTTRQDIAE